MNTVASIYIPHMEKHFNADYIANVFNVTDIAQVGKVVIEPYKKNKKNNKYNHAYIEIEYWHDTESAYNFIKRLQNPQKEARIVHNDDCWWVVEINKYPAKLVSNPEMKKPYKNSAINASDNIKIDFEKTKLLKNIIANFHTSGEKDIVNLHTSGEEDIADFDSYSREIDAQREIDDRIQKWFTEVFYLL